MRLGSSKIVRAKIVCTIGPASNHQKTLGAMADAGMDVARLNLSHGEFEDHKRIAETIREMGNVSILLDLPGPKIRIGEVDGRVILSQGDRIHFTTRSILGSNEKLSISYDNLPKEVRTGGSIFINDGLIEIKITSVDNDLKGFIGKVVSGGEIVSHKGVNAPGAQLSMNPPTDADLEGITFGVDFCDWFAISFVRKKEDVKRTRQAISKAGGEQPIISKIEHQEAIRNIDDIIEASDGIMVARGDLGIEVPPWEVPLLQKRIITKSNDAGKPVIVATQMLESMVSNPRPTRAEASDVANAILDGADAVMLSEETAVGLFPVESVKVMNEISQTAEQEITLKEFDQKVGHPIADIIGNIASRAAATVGPAAIIVVTRSGFSARMVSKHRPRSPILSVAKTPEVNRRTRLYWGVEPIDVPWTENRDELIIRAVNGSIERGFLQKSDTVMIVSGSTLEAPGRTSSLEILNIENILQHALRKD